MSSGEAAMVEAGTKVSRAGDWLTAEVNGELIMMNGSTGRYIGLSETGRRVWDLLAQPSTFAALCDALASEYDATPQQVAGDVSAFLKDLHGHGAIALDAA